jgi:hypothetical protein
MRREREKHSVLRAKRLRHVLEQQGERKEDDQAARGMLRFALLA